MKGEFHTPSWTQLHFPKIAFLNAACKIFGVHMAFYFILPSLLFAFSFFFNNPSVWLESIHALKHQTYLEPHQSCRCASKSSLRQQPKKKKKDDSPYYFSSSPSIVDERSKVWNMILLYNKQVKYLARMGFLILTLLYLVAAIIELSSYKLSTIANALGSVLENVAKVKTHISYPSLSHPPPLSLF